MLMIAQWLETLQAIYFTIDRVWLGLGIVVCVLLGTFASRYVDQSGLVWQIIVTALVAVGLFVVFLALTQVNPVFFNATDLARSQVSI